MGTARSWTQLNLFIMRVQSELSDLSLAMNINERILSLDRDIGFSFELAIICHQSLTSSATQ